MKGRRGRAGSSGPVAAPAPAEGGVDEDSSIDNPFRTRPDGSWDEPVVDLSPDSEPAVILPVTPADQRDAVELTGVQPAVVVDEAAPEPDSVAPLDADSAAALEPSSAPAPEPAASPVPAPIDSSSQAASGGAGFLSPAPPRRPFESALVRLVATCGVVGIGTAVGAILAASHVAGWIIGLVVSLVSVILAAVLWRSRRL